MRKYYGPQRKPHYCNYPFTVYYVYRSDSPRHTWHTQTLKPGVSYIKGSNGLFFRCRSSKST